MATNISFTKGEILYLTEILTGARSATARQIMAKLRTSAQPDMVEITCYGETTTMERSKAIAFYSQGVSLCEGAERDRYANVLMGLQEGLNKVTDQRY